MYKLLRHIPFNFYNETITCLTLEMVHLPSVSGNIYLKATKWKGKPTYTCVTQLFGGPPQSLSGKVNLIIHQVHEQSRSLQVTHDLHQVTVLIYTSTK